MVKNLSKKKKKEEEEESVGQWKRRKFDPWVRKITWSRKWQLAPIFLPGKFHGQRRMMEYSLWGHKESDTTEHTHTHSFLVISLGFFMYSVNIMSSRDRFLLLFQPRFLEFLFPPSD